MSDLIETASFSLFSIFAGKAVTESCMSFHFTCSKMKVCWPRSFTLHVITIRHPSSSQASTKHGKEMLPVCKWLKV